MQFAPIEWRARCLHWQGLGWLFDSPACKWLKYLYTHLVVRSFHPLLKNNSFFEPSSIECFYVGSAESCNAWRFSQSAYSKREYRVSGEERDRKSGCGTAERRKYLLGGMNFTACCSQWAVQVYHLLVFNCFKWGICLVWPRAWFLFALRKLNWFLFSFSPAVNI